MNKTYFARQRTEAPRPKPIGGLLDKRFVYVPAAATDIRQTFARIRAEQQQGVRL